MDPASERHVFAGRPPKVQPLRIREHLRVVVRPAQQRDHVVPGLDLHTVDLERLQHQPPCQLHRRVEPQQLLHRVPDDRWIVAEVPQLVGMPAQREQAVADEPRRGLVASNEQQRAHGDDLLVGELLPLLLRVRQRADEVLAGAAPARGNQPPQVLPERHARLGGLLHPVPRHHRVERVDQVERPLLHLLAVLLRHAEQVADDGDRDGVREVGHDVERAPVGDLVEDLRHELLHARVHRRHHARRERLVHQPAQPLVLGRIQEQHGRRDVPDPLGIGKRRQEDLVHRRFPTVARHVRVAQQPLHVAMPRQHVRAGERLVDRRGLPEPPVVRVRVLMDVGPERVEQHLGHVGLRGERRRERALGPFHLTHDRSAG